MLQVTLDSGVAGAYVPELSDINSSEYKDLKAFIEALLTTAYSTSGFAGVEVTNFWLSGSNIAAW